MCFRMKNILKNNRYYTSKHPLHDIETSIHIGRNRHNKVFRFFFNCGYLDQFTCAAINLLKP